MTEMLKTPLELWVTERYQDSVEMRFRVSRSLFSGVSDFQQIDIVETTGFGRMLFNDSIAMVSERDEFVYHEMIAHVPMFVHPAPKRVLVIGGGDGGTVREVIRHRSVEHCRLVEIDPLVVEGCKKHLRQMSAALDDPKVEVTIGDGVRFAAEAPEGSYDLVLVDSTDPIGPATPLFGEEFYDNVHRILTPEGIVVAQAESPFYELDWQKKLVGLVAGRFATAQIYNYANLTYPGGLWSFTFGSKSGLCPVVDLDEARVAAAGLKCRFYSSQMHRAAFVHPPFQEEALAGSLTPIRNG